MKKCDVCGITGPSRYTCPVCLDWAYNIRRLFQYARRVRKITRAPRYFHAVAALKG